MKLFNTKIIMTMTSAVLGFTGLILIFIPKEILQYVQLEITRTTLLATQILGTLYFAFAILNWMTRNSVVGGIYNRPVVMANRSHFFIVTILLTKMLILNPALPFVFWVVEIIYLFFFIAFALISLKNPSNKNNA